jgi:hypothetical protein
MSFRALTIGTRIAAGSRRLFTSLRRPQTFTKFRLQYARPLAVGTAFVVSLLALHPGVHLDAEVLVNDSNNVLGLAHYF